MSERCVETTAVDTLVIARKLMGGSRGTLQDVIRATVDETYLGELQGRIESDRYHAVDLIMPSEFVERKLAHPVLRE